MSLEFYLLSLVFAFFLGYSFSSESFVSNSNVGQVALFAMGIVSLGLVGRAIWIDSWLAGIIEVAVITGGFLFERMIAKALKGG